jgi:hypothetical protein
MKILAPGHKYELENVGGEGVQQIQFIEKVKSGDDLKIVQNGTTTEEVISILIDRIKFLQVQLPCDENEVVISNLEGALTELQKRTEDRQARKVDGQPVA